MTSRGWSNLSAALIAIASMPTSASWLSADELQRHCGSYLSDQNSRGGTLCAAFIQGFIAGTSATEQEIDASVEHVGAAGNESFAERAARTRIGSRLQQEAVSGYSGYYCLEDDAPAEAVVARVTATMQQASDYLSDSRSAEELVHEALVLSFPCDGE